MLTVKVVRISEVLWNSLFMKDMPGAIIELDNGLDILLVTDLHPG